VIYEAPDHKHIVTRTDIGSGYPIAGTKGRSFEYSSFVNSAVDLINFQYRYVVFR